MSVATTAAPTRSRIKPPVPDYPAWSPRFWHGMRAGDWFGLLAAHGFRIHPSRLPMAAAISTVSLVNSALYWAQQLRYGRRLPNTPIEHPPVFIIGHWRSGTTFLHELLIRDPQFGYPTTYECFAPSHFLVSEWIIPPLVSWLLPRKRPMDDMGAGFDYPQEDEFALANLGCPTPYLRLAFPNDPPCYMELLDTREVPDELLDRWRQGLLGFVQALTLAKGKRLVLKSPPHTGRIQLLSQLFPGAKFIHIARHPEKLFVSTRRLWMALDQVQGLQLPHFRNLDEYIFESFERMYGGFEQQRAAIDPEHLCDVRYEELVRSPLEQVEAIYRQLGLGDFETVREDLQACVNQRRDYQPNRHEALEPEVQTEVRRRWAGYYQRYGY